MLSRRFFLRCLTAAAAATALPFSSARAATPSLMTETRLMMGTFVTIKTSGVSSAQASDAMGSAFERMASLEAALTRFDGASAIGQLNASGRLSDAPAPLLAVVRSAAGMHRVTGGFFDPTVLSLLEILEKHSSGLNEREMSEASELVGMTNVKIENDSICFLRGGMKMSLDGIAKGYIADEGARVMRSFGVRNFLINAGGDIVADGDKAGTPWRVAVENPEKYRGNTAYPAVRTLKNQAMATSGSYENVLGEKGELNHLINPVTGRCATLPGASVVASSAMEADALATALCVMPGPASFMEKLPDSSCLLTLPAGRVQRSSRWS
ncbi:FAD:protein FMN transferase [uncultured Mailhella sp.]|uniref:FAD:protein FMN transferase n=1 Tax=uncultured Mailhella sp. TaxID=1981031 RepID=UPI0025EF5F58|nr:FAD:protein FMN transferase [uncultured Mailhella sp.]